MVFGRSSSKKDPIGNIKSRVKNKSYDLQEKEDKVQDTPPGTTESDVMQGYDLAQQVADRLKQNQGQARQEGQQYAQDLFNRNTQGLTPERRQNLQIRLDSSQSRSKLQVTRTPSSPAFYIIPSSYPRCNCRNN